MPSSVTSRRCMALGIATRISDRLAGLVPTRERGLGRLRAQRRLNRRSRRRIGPCSLTRRILATNVLAIALLRGGMLYLDRYERGLILTALAARRTQADVSAAARCESAVNESP